MYHSTADVARECGFDAKEFREYIEAWWVSECYWIIQYGSDYAIHTKDVDVMKERFRKERLGN